MLTLLCNGLLVAQFCQTGAEQPSAIILRGICGPDLGHSNFAIQEGLFTQTPVAGITLVTYNQMFQEK